MKKSFVLIVITTLFNFSYTFSQQNKIIRGQILDSLENPIKYVNIGILNKPIGTVSNNKGEFTLNLDNSFIFDTLKISSLGFKSKHILIKELFDNSNNIFFLDSYTEELDEVVISSNNLKIYKTGKEKTKSKRQVFFANPETKNMILGSQIGRKFSIGKKKFSLLQELKFYIKSNNYEQVKFRVNIYSIKDNVPLKRVNSIDILTEVARNQTGWIKVDLTKYDINVKENVIIAIEWIEASKKGNTLSLPIFVPSFNSTHYYKYSSQAKWRKYKMVSSAMVLTYKQ
ncbi:MAG: carboxypeptidase-like regulatory domain-containing protein [Flavobacteriaceae bacterium]